MANDRPKKKTTEFLKLPSTAYGARGGAVVDRMPLLYGPSSTADLDFSRLPGEPALKTMELTYREEFFDESTLAHEAGALLRQIIGVSIVIVLAIVAVAPLVGVSTMVEYGGYLALVIVGAQALSGQADIQKMVLIGIAVPLALGVAHILSQIVSVRWIGAGILGILALVWMATLGRMPLRFYRNWIFAHPRLTPGHRKLADKTAAAPNVAVLFAILGIAIVVPHWSPSIAILAILALSILVLRGELFTFGVYRKLRIVLGRYLLYGLGSTGAPGVWRPKQTRRQRVATTYVLFIPFFLALSVGTYAFGAWDLAKDSLTGAGLMGRGGMPESLLRESTYAWIGGAWGRGSVFWLVPLSVLLNVTVPLLAFAAVYRDALVDLEVVQQKIETVGPEGDARPEWQWYVDRLRLSKHIARTPLDGAVHEAEHLFVGVEPRAQFPVLLDKRILSEHCYISGETGSGKTALGITPLLLQLIRGHGDPTGRSSVVETDHLTPPPPIVVLDLKGDPALFHTVRAEVEARRQALGIEDEDDPRYAFRFFTPEQNRASHVFDPMQSLESDQRSEIQLCQVLLDSLGLNHGEGYGRSYFSRRNRMLLFEALTKGGAPGSFEDLFERLKAFTQSGRGPDGVGTEFDYQQDGFELLSTVHSLSQYPMLAPWASSPSVRRIHMPTLLEHSQVAYFWLPSAIESISVREIGKMALYCLLTAAVDRQREGSPPRQAYLVVDEFQRLAGENFKIILEQARSFGVAAILANQSQADLKTPDSDLRPTVRTNTRVKMHFATTDVEEVQALSALSGEELSLPRSWGFTDSAGGTSTKTSWSQSIKARLTTNDILHASDHPLECVFHVSRGSGYTQLGGLPITLRTSYPLNAETYRRRAAAPWPEADEKTVVSTRSPLEREREKEEQARRRTDELMRKVFSDPPANDADAEG